MKFNALLVGPEDTPYEYGMFEFLLKFPNGDSPLALFDLRNVKIDFVDYPSKAPQYVLPVGMTDVSVTALTTDKGRTRFNPNVRRITD